MKAFYSIVTAGAALAWLAGIISEPANAQSVQVAEAAYNILQTSEGPVPPSDLDASKGVYASKIRLDWSPSTSTGLIAAVAYEVWRSQNLTRGPNDLLTTVYTNFFDDTTAEPGTIYYYWLRSVANHKIKGDFSDSDYGYQQLAPPQSLKASAGEYSDRVKLSWAATVGAFSYRIFRTGGKEPKTTIYHTETLEFDDILVQPGIVYRYQVQAVKGLFTSSESAPVSGYVLSPVVAVNATKGTLARQVKVSWNAVEGATAYEIWRSENSSSYNAIKIATVANNVFYDKSAQPGKQLYYWIKSKSTHATSAFSPPANGYAAENTINLAISDLIVLPRVIPARAHPAIISFRLKNNGPAALTKPNTAVQITFYMGTSSAFSNALPVGSVRQNITLAAGQSTNIIIKAVSNITMPVTSRDYYIFAKITPVLPNLLACPAPPTARRAGTIHASKGGKTCYWTPDDYSGDGKSDLAVYGTTAHAWWIRTPAGAVLWDAGCFGAEGLIPTVGDYDGDHKADPALYDPGSGTWWVMLSGSGYQIASATALPGGVPVPGDYDGDGKADLITYDENSGLWSGLISGSGYALAGDIFGAPGFHPVPGDYDGDGVWDLAVYQQSNGAWYIRTTTGKILRWNHAWGGRDWIPASGDYDGDGAWDLAVYNQRIGFWKMENVAGKKIEPELAYMGGQGWYPLSGDFNGDGIADLAIYQPNTGRWKVMTMSSQIIIDTIFGAPDVSPVCWP